MNMPKPENVNALLEPDGIQFDADSLDAPARVQVDEAGATIQEIAESISDELTAPTPESAVQSLADSFS